MLFHKRETEAQKGGDPAQIPQLKGGRAGIVVLQAPWLPRTGTPRWVRKLQRPHIQAISRAGMRPFPGWPGAPLGRHLETKMGPLCSLR